MSKNVIKAIVTTLDNLLLLKEQVRILQDDLLVSEIIIVSNGSKDGTNEWLSTQKGLTAIIRENQGAGPGRNAGLDRAHKTDFYLMLDGGIRPLMGGTVKMLNYLERHPASEDRFKRVDVIGMEIPHFETDPEKAWRRWPEHLDIQDPATAPPSPDVCQAYHNWSLSQTAYCLARREAFDGLRFSEEGPFGEPGWGADDDEMMCQWREAGIIVHVACNIHPYRRASGSFRRLFQETGIWPNQYGSVYEGRVVWLQQNWPQYNQGIQWGEPWLTVVIVATTVGKTAKLIKKAHDLLRQRTQPAPYDNTPQPYSVIVCGGNEKWLDWAEPRRLRQHHGNTIIVEGQIVRRGAGDNEKTWTGDFHICAETDWEAAVRPGAFYYGLVRNEMQLVALVDEYNRVHPQLCLPTKRLELSWQ